MVRRTLLVGALVLAASGTGNSLSSRTSENPARRLCHVVLRQRSSAVDYQVDAIAQTVTARFAEGGLQYSVLAAENDDALHLCIAPAKYNASILPGYQTTFLSDDGLQGLCSGGVIGRHTLVDPRLGRTMSDPPGRAVTFGRDRENPLEQSRFDALYQRSLDTLLKRLDN
ncbi:MAG TPA: hypothetical protein VJK52_01080 [Candidatus Nanoarchaeia archaeon]|nr:hypothetical protein [Candidatus Nanoarchaeia archaeon]